MRRYQVPGTGQVSLLVEFLRMALLILDGIWGDTAILIKHHVCIIKLTEQMVMIMVGIHIQMIPALKTSISYVRGAYE